MVLKSFSFSNHSYLFFRAFSFKKKSPLGTTKVEIPTKVISSNVLANRNVNVPNSLVTKSPLTFSNKPERPQKSQINNFSVSSQCKSDSISPASNSAPAVQPSSAVAAPGKVSTAPSKSDKQSVSCNATSLDASLGFPMDNWDDLDDFETPSKAKNDSPSPAISGKSKKAVLYPSEDKPESKERQSHIETDKLEHSVDRAEVSRRPSPIRDPAECKLEDSAVKMTRRHPPAYLKSVVSDSEEDSNVPFEAFETRTGNKLFIAAYVFYLYIGGQTRVWHTMNYTKNKTQAISSVSFFPFI